MLAKYPFLVKLKVDAPLHGEGVASGTIDDAAPTIFSDDEYPSEILDDFLFLGSYGTLALHGKAVQLHRRGGNSMKDATLREGATLRKMPIHGVCSTGGSGGRGTFF